jgi:hypothetical protein
VITRFFCLEYGFAASNLSEAGKIGKATPRRNKNFLQQIGFYIFFRCLCQGWTLPEIAYKIEASNKTPSIDGCVPM